MLRNVWLFAAQWTVACQTSTEFSRQEYWSGLPFPTPGDLLNSGIKPLHLLHWQADSLPLSHLGSNIQGLPQPITAFAIIARLWSTKRLKLEKKLRLKLKKVGKPTRPIRYDLNQISYDYTVEVINRFKGWDLRDKVPEDKEPWTQMLYTVQEAVTNTIPKKNKSKKAKWLSEEALHTAEERREAKSKGEREAIQTEGRVPENSKER